ncbi:Uncharacterized protein APZ42_000056 [Daphnia magna]|uniref:Uncharacterized protein n=1 Tax=Daphnia magna TaxID=35525 RepID=A0A164JY60_9CRUS|nr:Uncharacterized protein APZ42_000056 [Daphnia magna]
MDTVILDQGNKLRGVNVLNNIGMYYVARLAQLVERGTFNPEVEGSSPSSCVI